MFASIVSRLRGKSQVIPAENRPNLILQPSIDIADYVPDPAEDCFCGSNKLFKSCCGSRESRRPPPTASS